MIRKLSLVLAVALLSGCSHDSLDRDSAAEKISSRLSANPKHIMLRIGRVGSHCETIDFHGESHEIDQDPNKNDSVVAVKAGYITAVPDGKGYWKVALTDKGQAFLNQYPARARESEGEKGCEFRQIDFPIATASLVNITGITAGDAERQVDYTWKWVVTDLGVALRQKGEIYPKLTPKQLDYLQFSMNLGSDNPKLPLPVPEDMEIRDTATFKHYDDGWRLQ